MGKKKKKHHHDDARKNSLLKPAVFSVHFFCHGCMFIVFPAVIRME